MSTETRFQLHQTRAVEITTEYNRLAEVIRNLPDSEITSPHADYLRTKRDALAHQAIGLLSLITGV